MLASLVSLQHVNATKYEKSSNIANIDEEKVVWKKRISSKPLDEF